MKRSETRIDVMERVEVRREREEAGRRGNTAQWYKEKHVTLLALVGA